MKIHVFDPVFKGHFTVFVGDFGLVRRYVHARGFDDPGVPQLAKTIFMSRDGNSEIVMWFRPDWRPNSPRGAAVLAHEALHAVHFALKARGMSNGAILDEVANYYLEWLIAEIAARSVKRITRKRTAALARPQRATK